MAQTKQREGKIRPKLKTEEEAEQFVKNSQETGEPESEMTRSVPTSARVSGRSPSR